MKQKPTSEEVKTNLQIQTTEWWLPQGKRGSGTKRTNGVKCKVTEGGQVSDGEHREEYSCHKLASTWIFAK